MSTDGIARRIARLMAENPPPCETCGFDPGEPITGCRVEWSDAIEPDEPEYCATCGRADRIVVTWADDDKGGA